MPTSSRRAATDLDLMALLLPPRGTTFAQRELLKRFHTIIVSLKAIVENGPAADELDSINYKSLEMIEFQLEKLGPQALDLISGYLARIRKPRLTVVKP